MMQAKAISARLVLEALDVGVQRTQLIALVLARRALLAQLRLLLAQRGLLLADERPLLAHLLPRLQDTHLQLRALALGVLTCHRDHLSDMDTHCLAPTVWQQRSGLEAVEADPCECCSSMK